MPEEVTTISHGNRCKNFLTGFSASTLPPSFQRQHSRKKVSQICLKPISNSPFWLTRPKGSAPITSYRSLPAHSDPATMASLNFLTLEPSFWQLPRPGMWLLHGSPHTPWSLSVETFFICPSYLTFSRRPPLTTLFHTSVCLQPLHLRSQSPKPT